MCGILGIFNHPDMEMDTKTVNRALDRIAHRGPDDEGYVLLNSRTKSFLSLSGKDTDIYIQATKISEIAPGIDFNICLGHRRLSIIDLSVLGHQPMANANSSVWIVYNGEIYNYLELKQELKSLGYEFQSDSDTEVILASYETWGISMLTRFIGMFAFALIDLKTNKAFLCRDHFGIKPLYYSIQNECLIFCSEMKGMLEFPQIKSTLSPQDAYDYLFFGQADAGESTLFLEIQQVSAAHYLEYDLASNQLIANQCYWSLNPKNFKPIRFQDAIMDIRDLVQDSVRLHMRSDVPLGSCLSGGLDSSAIVRFISQNSIRQVSTFSYITNDIHLGEEKYIDLLCKIGDIFSYKVNPSPDDLLKDISKLIYLQETPFGGLSIYAQYKVFELAKSAGLKVMLDGQGADEIFGGYNGAISSFVASLFCSFQIRKAVGILQNSTLITNSSRGKFLLSSLGRLAPRYLRSKLLAVAGKPAYPDWLNSKWFASRGVKTDFFPNEALNIGIKNELIMNIVMALPQLLRYEDRNSMVHSIESRVPFCNPKLAEYIFSLPEEYFISDDGKSKYLLSEAMRGILPNEIINRQKVSFSVPERLWFNKLKPWIFDKLDLGGDFPLINQLKAKEMVVNKMKGNDYFLKEVWRCANFIQWAHNYSVVL